MTFELQFEPTTCCTCGLTFAVPIAWYRKKRETHERFCCPNGCKLEFSAKTELDRVREETDRARAEAKTVQAQLNEERHLRLVRERELEKLSKAKAALENRVSKGQCPCCNRTFKHLARHMSSKHPEKVEGALPPKGIESGTAAPN
jgi:transposase-like protein